MENNPLCTYYIDCFWKMDKSLTIGQVMEKFIECSQVLPLCTEGYFALNWLILRGFIVQFLSNFDRFCDIFVLF